MRYGGAEVGGVGKTDPTIDIRKKRFDDENKASNNPIGNFINNLPNLINGSMRVENSEASTTVRAYNGEQGTIA